VRTRSTHQLAPRARHSRLSRRAVAWGGGPTNGGLGWSADRRCRRLGRGPPPTDRGGDGGGAGDEARNGRRRKGRGQGARRHHAGSKTRGTVAKHGSGANRTDRSTCGRPDVGPGGPPAGGGAPVRPTQSRPGGRHRRRRRGRVHARGRRGRRRGRHGRHGRKSRLGRGGGPEPRRHAASAWAGAPGRRRPAATSGCGDRPRHGAAMARSGGRTATCGPGRKRRRGQGRGRRKRAGSRPQSRKSPESRGWSSQARGRTKWRPPWYGRGQAAGAASRALGSGWRAWCKLGKSGCGRRERFDSSVEKEPVREGARFDARQAVVGVGHPGTGLVDHVPLVAGARAVGEPPVSLGIEGERLGKYACVAKVAPEFKLLDAGATVKDPGKQHSPWKRGSRGSWCRRGRGYQRRAPPERGRRQTRQRARHHRPPRNRPRGSASRLPRAVAGPPSLPHRKGRWAGRGTPPGGANCPWPTAAGARQRRRARPPQQGGRSAAPTRSGSPAAGTAASPAALPARGATSGRKGPGKSAGRRRPRTGQSREAREAAGQRTPTGASPRQPEGAEERRRPRARRPERPDAARPTEPGRAPRPQGAQGGRHWKRAARRSRPAPLPGQAARPPRQCPRPRTEARRGRPPRERRRKGVQGPQRPPIRGSRPYPPERAARDPEGPHAAAARFGDRQHPRHSPRLQSLRGRLRAPQTRRATAWVPPFAGGRLYTVVT